MERFAQTSRFLVCLVLCLLMGAAGFPAPGLASTAKQKYLEADNCFKNLRNSPLEKQKISTWLNCINQYEKIYQSHPTDSWAPAGMYKAAELYLQLEKFSGNTAYRSQSLDLLARIKNRYPESAYSIRAKTLAQSLTPGPTLSTQSPAPDPGTGEPSVKRSKKAETRRDRPVISQEEIDPENDPENGEQPGKEPDQTVSPPLILNPETQDLPDTKAPEGDTQVTDLRFWSNPEYTRIVINTADERKYSHHLLKKDPAINKPLQRLYIDIEQTRLGKGVADHMPINDDLLEQARAGQFTPHTVRVVVDIKSFENYKIFSLKDPFRIIIDVWGKGANGPQPDPEIAQEDGGKASVKTSRITTDNLKSSDIARQLALGVSKIVIDPGHGGSDPGAPGYLQDVWEKDIVLKLATNLADKLRSRLKCTVVLTRSSDRKLTLEERTAIANTQRADLFISLHSNAAQNKNLSGFETYFLNLATDDQAIAVAARENATSKKNISDLEFILTDLMKHAKIAESTRLANDVHQTMVRGMTKKYSGINDLGVKQAPFYVLLGARMPSILIEASFISNKEECKRLLTESYRNDLCASITDGIEKYIKATNPKQL